MNTMNRAEVYKAAADLLSEYGLEIKFIPDHFGENLTGQTNGLPAIAAHEDAKVEWAITVVVAADLAPNIAMGTPFTRTELAQLTRQLIPRNKDLQGRNSAIFY